MSNMTKGKLWYKANGLIRYLLAHTSTKILPLYVVNEYPKSGGSWVGEMLSEALNVPFPRNQLPVFRSSILHGHMMHSWNMHNTLCVWRDGRDVLVSQYFHWLFKNDRGNAPLVARSRADLGFSDYNDIASNLVPFMEYVYEHPSHPRFTWVDFVDKWLGRSNCVHVRYEDLRTHPVTELKRIIFELSGIQLDECDVTRIVDDHSFEKLSGRKVGEVNQGSFLRKGVVGDWENNFTRDARIKFNSYAGEALVKLGYETNCSWVNEEHLKTGS